MLNISLSTRKMHFKCCEITYIGRCNRHLKIESQNMLSVIWKQRKKTNKSAIGSHLLENPAYVEMYDVSCFEILTTDWSKFQVLEDIFINHNDGQVDPVLPERICLAVKLFQNWKFSCYTSIVMHYSTLKVIACITIENNAQKLVMVVRKKIFKIKLNFMDGVRSFKSCKKSFEKKYFHIFGKSPKSRKNFWNFFLPMNSIYPYEDIDTSLKLIGHVCEAQ